MFKKSRIKNFLKVFTFALFACTMSFCTTQVYPVNRTDGIFDFCSDDSSECVRIASKDIHCFTQIDCSFDSPENKKIKKNLTKRFAMELDFLGKQDTSEIVQCDFRSGLYEHTKILVLRVGGEVVGLVRFTSHGPIPGQFYLIGEISMLAVSKEFRRKGYGKRLLNAAIKYLQEKGCSKIFLITSSKNRGACALYEGTGFRINDRDPSADHNNVAYEFELKQLALSLSSLNRTIKTTAFHGKYLGWHVKNVHRHAIMSLAKTIMFISKPLSPSKRSFIKGAFVKSMGWLGL